LGFLFVRSRCSFAVASFDHNRSSTSASETIKQRECTEHEFFIATPMALTN